MDSNSIAGELVRFRTPDGVELHGFLKHCRNRRNAIVYLHGLCGTFYRNYYIYRMAEDASKAGIGFLSIEQRGSYVALGFTRNGKRRFMAGGAFEKFKDSARDIRGAIGFLRGTGYGNVYLVGHSTGCQKATHYVWKTGDRNVKALVLLAPADDYNINRINMGRGFKPAVSYARRAGSHSIMPERHMRQMFSAGRFLSFSDPRRREARIFNYDRRKLTEFSRIKVPILAIFGSDEQYADRPVGDYLNILERDTSSRKFSSMVIKGADHGFRDKDAILSKNVVGWLRGLEAN